MQKQPYLRANSRFNEIRELDLQTCFLSAPLEGIEEEQICGLFEIRNGKTFSIFAWENCLYLLDGTKMMPWVGSMAVHVHENKYSITDAEEILSFGQVSDWQEDQIMGDATPFVEPTDDNIILMAQRIVSSKERRDFFVANNSVRKV